MAGINDTFNNLRISRKLMLSFGLILSLLLITSFTGYKGLSRSDLGFDQYRELARDSNLAGRLQANLLFMQTELKSYLIKNNPETLNRYQIRLETMKGYLREAQQEIQKPERAALIREILQLVEEYERAANQIAEQIKIRNDRVNQVLVIKGPEMRKIVTGLRQYSYDNGLTRLSHYSGNLQESLILGRFYLLKYFDTHDVNDYQTARKQLTEVLDNDLVLLHQLGLSPQYLAELERFSQLRQTYLVAMDDTFKAMRQQASLAENVLEKAGPAIAENIEQVKLSVIADQEHLGPRLQSGNEDAKNLMGIMSVVALLVGTVSAITIGRQITFRLRKAVKVAEQIAKGDLRLKKETFSKDEIGHLQETLYQTGVSLKNMLGLISSASNNMSSASVQLSALTTQAMNGTQQQLLETDQVASAVNEMTNSAVEVADNTQHTAGATEEARRKADDGYRIVGRTLNNIQNLHMSVSQTEQRLESVQQETQNIGSIIDVIQDIAEQTNLLALNAAIEAARAGDQGRGFAVVADEVRSLAQRTRQSTGEIHQLIARLQEGANEVLEAMQEGRQIADTSLSLTQDVQQTLEGITSAIATINDMSIQIASAAEQQSKVAEEINQSSTSVRTIAEQSAHAVTETVSSSQSIKSTADELQALVSKFKL
ncbi:methyl-accepting chemotaxis protein [Oceanospirillum beijerinckii]|uniref:methyl-accepting chemotaxis protein n=1 Tax=Oceanospirillum beijerinckii TaxID=64976 RepID=UPI0004173CEC|nr:HAMP domain-containing methyl-accepting chemotaxis protein [Oceanospirillum beijerinckii]